LDKVFKTVPTNFVHRVVLVSPSGDLVETQSSEPLYAMIRRYEFDAALLSACREGGIEVREDVTVSGIHIGQECVTLTSSLGEDFTAEVVIAADGVNSLVAIHAGMRGAWEPLSVAIDGTEESPLTDLSVRQDTMLVYYGVRGGYGYGYVFPKVHHVNFGIGYLLDYYRKHVSGKPYEEHQQFLECLKSTGAIKGESRIENFHAYLLPVGGPLTHISRDRLLLAGDAAGFVNGFTAEGIYYAMVSGEYAAKTALESVRSRDYSSSFLQRYDTACEAEIGNELRKSVKIQKRLLSNPSRINSVVRIAARSASLRKILTDFSVGSISYEDLKKRAAAHALPAYLWYKATKLWHTLTRH
jgi:flavin-dependent dehydrogenase